MTTIPEPSQAEAADWRRSLTEDLGAAAEAEISERIYSELDALLARVDAGIAIERRKMDSLLERIARPTAA